MKGLAGVFPGQELKGNSGKTVFSLGHDFSEEDDDRYPKA